MINNEEPKENQPAGANMSSRDDELKELLKKNIELSEETLKLTKKIKSYWMLQRAYFALKVLIILVPIILGIIYLPPLLDKIIDQYKEIFNISNTASNIKSIDTKNINLESVPQLKELIK